MVIGIDASRVSVKQPTGTEHYSRQIISFLLRGNPEQRFILYFNQPPPPGVLENAENSTWRVLPAARFWTHGRLALEMVRHSPDALFVPAHVIPVIHPAASVVTVHDLGYRHFPSAHALRRRVALELATRFNCAVARRVIVPSDATRRDLEREYGVSGERVRVIHHGVEENLAPEHNPARLADVRARYGIRGEYLLYLGTLQPRKNVGRLVEAFSRARQRQDRDVTLVLAGQPGWLMGAIGARLAEAERRGFVLRPGYVAGEDLAALLSGALGFVFPSLHEGFGLPVLEAMACGAPVLASRTSSLPEVVGEAGLLVDPLDVEAIAAGLIRLMTDPALRSALTRAGLERAATFSWERSARATLDVIREAAVL